MEYISSPFHVDVICEWTLRKLPCMVQLFALKSLFASPPPLPKQPIDRPEMPETSRKWPNANRVAYAYHTTRNSQVTPVGSSAQRVQIRYSIHLGANLLIYLLEICSCDRNVSRHWFSDKPVTSLLLTIVTLKAFVLQVMPSSWHLLQLGRNLFHHLSVERIRVCLSCCRQHSFSSSSATCPIVAKPALSQFDEPTNGRGKTLS